MLKDIIERQQQLADTLAMPQNLGRLTPEQVREQIEATAQIVAREVLKNVKEDMVKELTWYKRDEGVDEFEPNVMYIKLADFYSQIQSLENELSAKVLSK